MAKILLVDDDLFFMQMLRDVLEKHGHEVMSAPDGEVALRMFYDATYDLVISDLIMPNVDGMEFIIEIRKSHPDIKIIAISGGDVSLTANTYLSVTKDFGVDYTFEKPIENKKLLDVINELTNPKPAELELL